MPGCTDDEHYEGRCTKLYDNCLQFNTFTSGRYLSYTSGFLLILCILIGAIMVDFYRRTGNTVALGMGLFAFTLLGVCLLTHLITFCIFSLKQ